MEVRVGKSYSILMGNKTSKQLETFVLRSHWIYSLEFFDMIPFMWRIL